MSQQTKQLSSREKLATILVLMLLKILSPWEYEHQFKEVFDQIKQILKED